MQCPKCQFGNLEGMIFCGKCGYKLSISSKIAIKELSLDKKLAKIQRHLPKGLTKRILSQRNRIQGERRQVTVMLCDLRGFTLLMEQP